MVRPSRRREMAKKAVETKGVSIELACRAFKISESCYRYEKKLNEENKKVEDWLLRLTDNNRNWGFGLCYLHIPEHLDSQSRNTRTVKRQHLDTSPAHLNS